jgi:chemotaxis protein histidine kinase CheA
VNDEKGRSRNTSGAASADPLRGLEEIEESPRDTARRQIALLEAGLSSAGQVDSALMDETYRAAHLLRGAVDPAASPGLANIARQLQALVLATRAGSVTLGPGVLPLLRAAARAARAELERGRAGSSADEAAAALAAFLAGTGAPAAILQRSDGPVRYSRIEDRRLHAARAALAAAGPSVAALSRVAEQAAATGTRLREMGARRAGLAAELLAAIPDALAAAARGVPVSEIAGGLAERFSGFGEFLVQGEDALAGMAAQVREAADATVRSTAALEAALSRIDRVFVRNVLSGIGAGAGSAARAAGRQVAVQTDLGDAEIPASMATLLRSAVQECIRIMASPATSERKGARPRDALSLSVKCGEEAGGFRVSIELKGNPVPGLTLEKRLAPVSLRLARARGSLEVRPTRGRAVSVLVTLPVPARSETSTDSFVLVRAGGALWAVPASKVEECVPALAPGTDYVRDGKRLRVLALGGTSQPAFALIVKTRRGRAAVTVEEIVGEETMRAEAAGDGAPAAAARADGTKAVIADPDSLPGRSSPG